MKARPPLILFDFDGLSLSQRFALSWLAEHGGSAAVGDVTRGASEYSRKFGSLVSAQTIRALIRCGHLEVHRIGYVYAGWRVQLGEWARIEAARHPENPPLMLIACTRAEVAAHRESAQRVADTIATTWTEASATYCNHPYHDGDGPAPCPECGEGTLTHA